MIIRKFELRLSNPTTLAIAILRTFEVLSVSCFWSKIVRKVLTPFKCLKFVKSFAAIYSSHSLFVIAQTSFWIRLFKLKKKQAIGLKTWKSLRVEVIACGISCSDLERVWNLNGVSFFGLGIFKGCYTFLWNHTFNELRVFSEFPRQTQKLQWII